MDIAGYIAGALVLVALAVIALRRGRRQDVFADVVAFERARAVLSKDARDPAEHTVERRSA